MKTTEALKKIYEKIRTTRLKLLDGLSDKGIQIIEDEGLLEEWGTIAILNSYYIRELNNLTIYEIMHIQRKRNQLFDNSSTITILNCINLAKKFNKNENRNIQNISPILYSRIYWDNVSDISWSVIENGGGIACDVYGNIIVTMDNGNNWEILNNAELPRDVKRILPIAFLKNVFFIIICTSDQLFVFLYEYSMGHWFISNTDNNENLKLFHPSILYTGYHVQAFVQKINNEFSLVINAYGITDTDRSNFKTHTFSIPIKYESNVIKSIGLWVIHPASYLSKISVDSKIFFSKYAFNSFTDKIELETSVTRYIIYEATLCISIQTSVSSDLIITRKYNISAFDYGEISKDIGHTRNIRWIQTTLGYFFISSSMELFFVNNMKLFIPLDDTRGIALMSDKKLYIYSINELSELNIRNMQFNFGFLGSLPREAILHNELFGNIRIIFTDAGQISFIAYQNPSIISPSYQNKPVISQDVPYATDNMGTILAFNSPSIKYNINSQIREKIHNIIISNDNGISWSILQQLDDMENVYGIWYLDDKWVMLDQNGKIHWGRTPKDIMKNTGASLEDSNETFFRNRMSEYAIPGYNLIFEIVLDKMDILIIPVYHSMSDLNTVIDNPPFRYMGKIKNLFLETSVMQIINLYGGINTSNFKSLNSLSEYEKTFIQSRNSLLISSNNSETIVDSNTKNVKHSSSCEYIDYITGRRRRYSGRIYNTESKKELPYNKNICEIFNIGEEPILILESDEDDIYSIGRVIDDKIEEIGYFISNMDIDNLHHMGYDNFIIKNTHIYHIYNGSLYEHALEIVNTNNIVLSKCVTGNIPSGSRIKYIGGQIIILSNEPVINIGMLVYDRIHYVHNTNFIQDVCEWHNNIWYICNVNIENETKIFLSSSKYLYNTSDIYNSFLNSEFRNTTINPNDYYEIPFITIMENLILTPCQDFMLIWSKNSNILMKFHNYKFNKIEVEDSILCVAYSDGIVYLMTENKEIYYSYDGDDFNLYPQANANYIWNINGTLYISLDSKLIINGDIIGKNQGYIYNINNKKDFKYIHPYTSDKSSINDGEIIVYKYD